MDSALDSREQLPDSSRAAGPARLEQIAPGQLIAGRYRVDEAIGRGGMATVFRGYDQRLDRTVAVKVADPCPDSHRPPLSEERVSSALIHHNVVSIFDAGEIPEGEPGAGATFIVMEHVDGTTAREVAPVPCRRAAALVRQAADGLAAAHQRGIVHCDVKPGNLLIDRNGRVKVADFGVALTAGSDAGELVHGSPAFMAPERLLGVRPDPRVDVYGLGGVLAYMLTGRAPERDGMPALPPSCPPEVAAVIATARAIDPRARYADAAAFRDALERALEDEALADPADAPTQALPRAPLPETSPRRIRQPAGSSNSSAVPGRAEQEQQESPVARRAGGWLSPHVARRHVAVAAVALGLLLLGAQLAGWFVADPGPAGPASAATSMPDVRDQTFEAAIRTLAAEGIQVDRVEIVYAPGTLNLVVDQLPAPGDEAPEDGVVLVVRTSR
jgi:serine/threonine-protein kinase